MKVNLDYRLLNDSGEQLYADVSVNALIDGLNEVMKEHGETIPSSVLTDKVSKIKGEPLTVGIALRRTLLSNVDKQEVAIEEAQKRWEIALAMTKGGEYEFDLVTLNIIEQRLTKVWSITIAGQVMYLIKADSKSAESTTE
jgi:hypothetical protein